MERKISIGAWNYTPCGFYSAKECVNHWKELSFSLTLSSASKGNEEDDKYIIETLKLCEKENIKLIVSDESLTFNNLLKINKDEYEKRVKSKYDLFKKYKSFYRFLVGDEPHLDEWDNLKISLSIINKYTVGFLNFLAIDNTINCERWEGVDLKQYTEMLIDLIKNHGLKMLSFDYYSQCDFYHNQEGINNYIKNLIYYGELARENNVFLACSNLSVGHWSYRVPSIDDIRWQSSLSLALGVDLELWFYLYERFFEDNYRLAPFDLLKNKTPTHYSLLRENYYLNQIQEKLNGYVLKDYYFYGNKYKEFNKNNGDLPYILKFKHDGDALLSRFYNKDKHLDVLVNLSLKNIEEVNIVINGKNVVYHLAPGQAVIIGEK